MEKQTLPSAQVPSPDLVSRLKSRDETDRDFAHVARGNIAILTSILYPDIPFSLRLVRSRQFGTSLSVSWPLLPTAPGPDEVKQRLACFEADGGRAPKLSVAPNEKGLTVSEFRHRYGWVSALGLSLSTPTPDQHAAWLSRKLPAPSRALRPPRL